VLSPASLITWENGSKNAFNLLFPTPLIARNSSSVVGISFAICANVLSEKITYAGTERCLAMVNRSEYHKGKLSPERTSFLEGIDGWSWDPLADKWQRGFDALRAYVELNGNANVQQKHKTLDGYALGTWVSAQHLNYQNDRISKDRVKKLEQIPGWLWKAMR
jgi:hypothetical protein